MYEEMKHQVIIWGGYTVHFDVDRKQVIGIIPPDAEDSKPLPNKSKAMSREDATSVYVTHRPLRLVYKLMENPATWQNSNPEEASGNRKC